MQFFSDVLHLLLGATGMNHAYRNEEEESRRSGNFFDLRIITMTKYESSLLSDI